MTVSVGRLQKVLHPIIKVLGILVMFSVNVDIPIHAPVTLQNIKSIQLNSYCIK